jgi:Raf kinase inhibitor-like YbhB/YbcL family protein
MQPETSFHKMPLTLQVESSAFGMNGSIPVQFTAEGDDIAPPLSWTAGPPGTKSYALLVEDPDAPNPAAPERTWVHWIVTGIPATTTSLRGGNSLPDGAVVGTNDWGKREWGGPNPPIGRHRYFFKIYALDIALDAPGISKLELMSAMKGHILAQGELIGTYEKMHEKRSAEHGAERTTHGRR